MNYFKLKKQIATLEAENLKLSNDVTRLDKKISVEQVTLDKTNIALTQAQIKYKEANTTISELNKKLRDQNRADLAMNALELLGIVDKGNTPTQMEATNKALTEENKRIQQVISQNRLSGMKDQGMRGDSGQLNFQSHLYSGMLGQLK